MNLLVSLALLAAVIALTHSQPNPGVRVSAHHWKFQVRSCQPDDCHSLCRNFRGGSGNWCIGQCGNTGDTRPRDKNQESGRFAWCHCYKAGGECPSLSQASCRAVKPQNRERREFNANCNAQCARNAYCFGTRGTLEQPSNNGNCWCWRGPCTRCQNPRTRRGLLDAIFGSENVTTSSTPAPADANGWAALNSSLASLFAPTIVDSPLGAPSAANPAPAPAQPQLNLHKRAANCTDRKNATQRLPVASDMGMMDAPLNVSQAVNATSSPVVIPRPKRAIKPLNSSRADNATRIPVDEPLDMLDAMMDEPLDGLNSTTNSSSLPEDTDVPEPLPLNSTLPVTPRPQHARSNYTRPAAYRPLRPVRPQNLVRPVAPMRPASRPAYAQPGKPAEDCDKNKRPQMQPLAPRP